MVMAVTERATLVPPHTNLTPLYTVDSVMVATVATVDMVDMVATGKEIVVME